MKTANGLLLAAILLTTINCSSVSKTSTENVNVAAGNTANVQATPPTAASETSAAQITAPDALVKDLYKTHDKKNGSIVRGKDRKILDKYFNKNLAGLIWKDMTTNNNEVGVIDFDIFYNTQDPVISKFAVGAAKIEGDKASVPVTFNNSDAKVTVNYSLVKENSEWKISDINYDDNQSLVKYFKEASQSETGNQSSSGEFEGKYQIGETTCTVRPVKMAFEVKWEKGSGVEMFFSEGSANDRYIFASDPETGKANSFAFDDENYNTGTFYRADGKEFPIKRIK